MKYLYFLVLFFFSLNAYSEVLEEKKVYRLHKTVHDIPLARDASKKFIAVKESKFEVVDATNTSHYVVRFVTLYDIGKVKSTVRKDDEYLLSKTISSVPIEKSISLSRGGAVSGPLIVPFKYRLNDDSLTGEATLGYYAGYSVEPRLFWSDKRIPITPFIAGGVTQISVNEGEDETSNQTGVSLAAGILIQNWAGVNIGLVYGQDRIGNNEWEHEGDGWLSFMVGWEL
jgi:hypothetical protein